MHVFLTGGTGLIGTAVVAELLDHGHAVSALARSETAAAALVAAGATPVPGGLTDLPVLRAAAARSDGVIHLAFSNDFTSAETVAHGIAEEGAALTALGDELVGSGRPLVTVSGTPVVAGRASTEADPISTDGLVGGRARAVTEVLELASRGVRSAAVRLPRTVHENGTGGFGFLLAQLARHAGVSGYLGDGSQRWPAVHARDAAALFRLVLEGAPAGTAWHAVADEGDTMRDLATVIGRRIQVPVAEVAPEAFGPLAEVFAADQPATSVRTRRELGWEPTHESLLADLERLEPERVVSR